MTSEEETDIIQKQRHRKEGKKKKFCTIDVSHYFIHQLWAPDQQQISELKMPLNDSNTKTNTVNMS